MKKKNKICVIFTGGTIGSDSDGSTVSLSGGSKKMLLEKYRALAGGEVQFDELSPINILSENVQPDDLKKLYDCVKSVDAAHYDGIIITHGTDTLCFTVNLFSLLFRNCPVPVVFVSSLYPLTDGRNNGVKNFAGAVDFIESADLGGVFCAFANDGENCKIHLGSRLVYPDEINGFYHSALGAHLAEIANGKVIYNTSPLLPTAEEIKADGKEIPFALCDEVMLITMRSLLNFAVYDFSVRKPEAVIIELSHSGTVCTEGTALNFKKFAAYCKECGVPVIITPVMSRAGVYASMNDVPDNVIFAYDATVETTIAKVMCALGSKLSADAYLGENLAFEKIPFPVG
ncbi:MAG: asparaginase domain-containing protein [Clostridia bacterium]|nr:asparaginase domain-containing protein [Clostridia bacterium]